jgi:hypothetical protein
MGTDRMRRSSLHLKALLGVSIFAGTTIAAIAQEDPLDATPKPTLAEVQHLAEVIRSDEFKFRAYCQIGKLHDELQQAVQENNASAIAALIAKSDAFEQQLGPDYDKVLDGLDRIDFSSDEGHQIAEVFGSLQKKCE